MEDSSETTITNASTSSSSDLVTESGAAYIFTRSGTNWSQQAYIKASNASQDDQYGHDVVIHHDTLAVSAIYEDEDQTVVTNGSTSPNLDGKDDSGAVYVYRRDGSGDWQQEAYIKAVNGDSLDYFGSSLSFYGNELAVGSPGESEN